MCVVLAMHRFACRSHPNKPQSPQPNPKPLSLNQPNGTGGKRNGPGQDETGRRKNIDKTQSMERGKKHFLISASSCRIFDTLILVNSILVKFYENIHGLWKSALKHGFFVRPKISSILSLTLVINVFAKTGGWTKIYVWFYYLMVLWKVPEWFNSQRNRSRVPRIRTKFLRDNVVKYRSNIVPISHILSCTCFLIMCQKTFHPYEFLKISR